MQRKEAGRGEREEEGQRGGKKKEEEKGGGRERKEDGGRRKQEVESIQRATLGSLLSFFSVSSCSGVRDLSGGD